ncbi:acyl carrier protein [Arsenicicoccus bolidensis]|uniref:acyl carrier protein n=1 Tax=Arsenicicoccus bolidensis TaxID=229480 RepID=UPI0003059C3E|nr:acyl carrier protein [Arsenicicoccus bolidensis]
MTEPTTLEQVQEIFRDVLADPDLTLTRETVADQVDGWDSLAHVSLMFSVENAFGIQLSDAEMSGLSDVGALVDVVDAKRG